MSDTAIQHKRVKMGMSDTEISTFWGGKIQHFWASQEYNIYMHIQGSWGPPSECMTFLGGVKKTGSWREEEKKGNLWGNSSNHLQQYR